MREPTVLRLLIDACLTPVAVSALTKRFGARVDVVHVNDVLPPATSDAGVLDWAHDQGRLVITANDDDFVRVLLEDRPDHDGLGCIADQNTRKRQIDHIEQLVDALLSYVDDGNLLTGHVFIVRRTGRLTSRRIPPSTE